MKKEEFKVSFDKENNVLSVHVEVDVKPLRRGVDYYDTTRVIDELRKLDYEVSERQCIKRTRSVRSDDGEKNASGLWQFKIPQKKKSKPKSFAPQSTPKVEALKPEPVVEEKPEPVVEEKPEPAKKTTPKKKTTTKKSTRQTTQSVLESYKKG